MKHMTTLDLFTGEEELKYTIMKQISYIKH